MADHLVFAPVARKTVGQFGATVMPADELRMSIATNAQAGISFNVRLSWGRDVQELLGQLTTTGSQVEKPMVNITFARAENGTGYILMRYASVPAGKRRAGTYTVNPPVSDHFRCVTFMRLPEWMVHGKVPITKTEWHWSDEHGGIVITVPPAFIQG